MSACVARLSIARERLPKGREANRTGRYADGAEITIREGVRIVFSAPERGHNRVAVRTNSVGVECL